MTERTGFDIVSLGELLIDFTPVGVSGNNNPIFERNPGGGPANMACAAQKLGARTAFVGKVGDDNFGRALKGVLADSGVCTEHLLLSPEYQTTLAFVHLDASGDRSFSFYRRSGADTMLAFEEIDCSVLDGCGYFFCSSVLMTGGPSRETSFRMMRAAREKGIPVVFDPNLRMNLWSSPGEARRVVREALPLADLVKVSEEELVFLTGVDDLEAAAAQLLEQYHYQALLLTLGPKGSVVYANGEKLVQPAFEVKTIDTTAAGDSYTGGFLARLLRTGHSISACSRGELAEVARFASAVSSLTTAKKGGICALPSYEEVEALLDRSLNQA